MRKDLKRFDYALCGIDSTVTDEDVESGKYSAIWRRPRLERHHSCEVEIPSTDRRMREVEAVIKAMVEERAQMMQERVQLLERMVALERKVHQHYSGGGGDGVG